MANSITETLELSDIKIDGKELIFDYRVDSHYFRTEVYYDDVDFDELKKEYDPDFIDALITQIAVLTGIKYCSLAPRTFELTKYSHHLNEDFVSLFITLFNRIFAQHKYENELTEYEGPKMVVSSESLAGYRITKIKEGDVAMLLGCGGGKDSLATMKLLERADIPFATFQYSHSIYGKAKPQHEQIDRLTAQSSPERTHRIYIIDDFMTAPVVREHFPKRLHSLLDAETPSGIFQALPLMLAFGYTHLPLGHEKSADSGNLYWKERGEAVNHQWGKSFEAEKMLNEYITTRLITNFYYFSVLKPVYDYTIFHLLQRDQEAVRDTSSCNIEKPWCKRCPKCAYVWLCFMAYLDTDLIHSIFEENLFKAAELKDIFFQIIGHAGHRPFDCIGEVDESRLALHACMQKGVDTGVVGEAFEREILPTLDIENLKKKYGGVYDQHGIPDQYADELLKQMRSAADHD